MPTGLSGGEGGGVIDPADVRGAGAMEWESVTGVAANDPLVGAGPRGYNIEDRWNRVVTQEHSQSGPSSDVMATPDGKSAPILTHPRDLLNFHGSVAPWLLFGLLLIVFFGHLRLKVGGAGGGFGKSVKAGGSFS
jgi:hypothetical protein